MNKLLVACALLAPLVGCTGIAGNGSDQFGNGGNGASSSSGTSGTTPAGGNAGGSSASGGSAGTGFAGSGGASSDTGAGGMNALGGGSAVGGTSSGGACAVDALPSEVQTMLRNQCSTCHGASPLAGLPSLMTYANLTAPSKTDPTKTNAVLALARMQSATLPMPPAPGARVSATDVSGLQAFISAGYPKPSCPTGGGGSGGGGASGGSGGAGGSGGMMLDDPLNAMPTCTSKTSWTGGNQGSASMNPGLACISCHSMGGEAPRFSIAGTVYATGHEPDRCNSKVGTAGATIVIIGADGKQLTLTPNGVGNFSATTSVKTPFQAKVTYQGRERLMLTAQSNGDCNSCHTQNGAMMAPGRITIP
ncbi:MAG: hypothetical protein ABJB12_08340 [Pseudomonadota bacterium]